MKLWEKINGLFGFTRSEQRVVLFLLLTFVCGSIIKYLREFSSPQPVYDYAAPDSEFAARSDRAGSSRTGAVVGESAGRIGEAGARDSAIDINAATKRELMRLPGIGETIAGRIMAYRAEHAPFRKVGELMNVRGIGRKKFARIEKLCKVR